MERNTVDKEAFLCNIACGSNSRDVVRRIAFWRKAWSQRWQKWWNSMHCTDSWGCNWQTKKIKKKIVIELTRHFAASAQKRAKKVEKLVGLLLSSFCLHYLNWAASLRFRRSWPDCITSCTLNYQNNCWQGLSVGLFVWFYCVMYVLAVHVCVCMCMHDFVPFGERDESDLNKWKHKPTEQMKTQTDRTNENTRAR